MKCVRAHVLIGNLYNQSAALGRNLIKPQLCTQIKINLGDAPAGSHYLRQDHLVQKCICVACTLNPELMESLVAMGHRRREVQVFEAININVSRGTSLFVMAARLKAALL